MRVGHAFVVADIFATWFFSGPEFSNFVMKHCKSEW